MKHEIKSRTTRGTSARRANLTRLLAVTACLLVAFVAQAAPITVTIVYDNTAYAPGTTADWGFSCLVEGIDRPILYDSGNYSSILLNNLNVLQLDLATIDDFFLSHNHYDHTGGIATVLGINSQVNVEFGSSFPTTFEQTVSGYGATPIRVSNPIEICSFVHSTGNITGTPAEQSLIIEAAEGLVVITGCGHPGIIRILERAQEVVPRNIYLVIGGFHLFTSTEAQIQQVVDSFVALGVENVGPTHCTGDLAVQLFQQAYGEHCLPMGAGRVIEVSSLSAVGDGPGAGRSSADGFLDPCTPNPFNASTTIRYDVSEAADVRVTVHDLAGHTLATLAEGTRATPGRYEVIWDGRDAEGRALPSGIYLCRLTTPRGVQTTKMNLVK